MNTKHDITVIVGVGLLGGSLGSALKHKGLTLRVRGVGRNATSLKTAIEMGSIDEPFLDLASACKDASLIVVCTPAAHVPADLDIIRATAPHDAIVTDVASTKHTICTHARQTWPLPRRFVGSHPMAGSEKSGPQHAIASLYEGCVTIVEPLTPDIDPAAHAAVTALWAAMGSRVVEINPADHDALVARTSHLPHITAACLAILAASRGDVRPMVGKGFRDTTRVAAGRPELWRDICLTNASQILDSIAGFRQLLNQIESAIREHDAAALDAFFEKGIQSRQEALGE